MRQLDDHESELAPPPRAGNTLTFWGFVVGAVLVIVVVLPWVFG